MREGERIQVEQSLKYSAEESDRLWSAAGLTKLAKWATHDNAYGKFKLFHMPCL